MHFLIVITCILANDEAVEKFKDPTKLELTCQGNPDGGYEAMVISMSGGTFSYFDSGTIFKVVDRIFSKGE